MNRISLVAMLCDTPISSQGAEDTTDYRLRCRSSQWLTLGALILCGALYLRYLHKTGLFASRRLMLFHRSPHARRGAIFVWSVTLDSTPNLVTRALGTKTRRLHHWSVARNQRLMRQCHAAIKTSSTRAVLRKGIGITKDDIRSRIDMTTRHGEVGRSIILPRKLAQLLSSPFDSAAKVYTDPSPTRASCNKKLLSG